MYMVIQMCIEVYIGVHGCIEVYRGAHGGKWMYNGCTVVYIRCAGVYMGI